MQQLDQTLVAVANIFNNNNKYHLFAKVGVSKVYSNRFRRENTNYKNVFTTKRTLD
jgi:hypothetical protein